MHLSKKLVAGAALVLSMPGCASAQSIDELVGRWRTPSDSVVEIRKQDAARAEGLMVEPSESSARLGFRAGERVLEDIEVEDGAVRFTLVYRAVGCAPARVRFQGALMDDGWSIGGNVDYGRFEASGSDECRYTPGASFRPLDKGYSRIGEPGPLRFVARRIEPPAPDAFVPIDAVGYGEAFYVEAAFDEPREPPLVVIVNTSLGRLRTQLLPVDAQRKLFRSPPLTVVPPEDRP
jgi:hypothetical protein